MAAHPRQLLQQAARASVAVHFLATTASNSSGVSCTDIGTPGCEDLPSTAAIVGGALPGPSACSSRWLAPALFRPLLTVPLAARRQLVFQPAAAPALARAGAQSACLAGGRSLAALTTPPRRHAGVVGGLSVLTLGLAAALIFAVARIYGWSPLRGGRRWAWDTGAGKGGGGAKGDVEAALELARPPAKVPSIVTTRLAADGSGETAIARISDASAVRGAPPHAGCYQGGWGGRGSRLACCRPPPSGAG